MKIMTALATIALTLAPGLALAHSGVDGHTHGLAQGFLAAAALLIATGLALGVVLHRLGARRVRVTGAAPPSPARPC